MSQIKVKSNKIWVKNHFSKQNLLKNENLQQICLYFQ